MSPIIRDLELSEVQLKLKQLRISGRVKRSVVKSYLPPKNANKDDLLLATRQAYRQLKNEGINLC